MKSRFFAKLCFILTLCLLFSSLPVKASSVQDQSKPIFGLTADDVVEKYNQLSNQQKDQVLRSLGNTSIFANSLFGNIINSSFGVVSDAIKKLGDLFFQANGVVYKLGSSALAWVSRLIDKVFNNDISDVNISQPVINDLYLYTKDLYINGNPFFVVPNKPSINDSLYNSCFPLPSPVDFVYQVYYYTTVVCAVRNSSLIYNNVPCLFGPFIDYDNSHVGFCLIPYSINDNNEYIVNGSRIKAAPNTSYNNEYTSGWVHRDNVVFYDNRGLDYRTYDDLLTSLKTVLDQNFIVAYYYYVIENGKIYRRNLDTIGEPVNFTNNTYYNYIYNIPDETPLNVTNIVSNTSINYDPVENLIQYLPDNYNIEQNFSVVNNYYISSGSAVSGQVIDVNLVSPSVIDVRITNPEDLSSQVINENNNDIVNNYDFDFGDLDISVGVGSGLSSANDSLTPSITSGSSIVGEMFGGIPPDLLGVVFALLGLSLISGVIYRVTSG